MLYNRFLTGAMAIFLGAQGAFGLSHGEVSEFNGKTVRWQELSKGFFTGVPEEKWDDKLHKRGNVEWDLDEIIANSTTSTSSGDTGLESRDLKETCKAAQKCLKSGGQYVLTLAYQVWVSTADYASSGKLMEFLDRPFVANAAGVAVAGVISGQINEATKKECSTQPPESSQADIVRAALEAAIDKNPNAEEVSVDVEGPSGTVNIKVRAGAPNTSPNPTC